MPIMTKAQHAKREKLRAKLDLAQNAIYAAGPNRETRFSDCLALASDLTRRAYEKARADLDAFEGDMIADCRAYRGAFGMLIAY